MHSEGGNGAGPSLGRLLRSQGLGVCCGLAISLLLAVGSVVLSATRHGASASVQMDDFRAFLSAPSPVHLWFYLLVPVLTLYALNITLATWQNVAVRWRAGHRNPEAYAAALVHLAFLLALAAHLVGGLAGGDAATVIGGGWVRLPAGNEVRLLETRVDRLPNGMPRAIDAEVELRGPDGAVTSAVLGYNSPLSTGFGADLVLLQQPVEISTVSIELGGERCTIGTGGSCSLAGREIRLTDLRVVKAHGAIAELEVDGISGWIMQGRGYPLDAQTRLELLGVERESAVAVRLRHAPGNPWALAAAIVLTLGILLMWRRML